MEKPERLKTFITKTTSKCFLITLQKERLKCKQFVKEIRKKSKELHENNINVDNTWSNSSLNIFFENSSKVSPFMNRFWQTKLSKCSDKGAC